MNKISAKIRPKTKKSLQHKPNPSTQPTTQTTTLTPLELLTHKSDTQLRALLHLFSYNLYIENLTTQVYVSPNQKYNPYYGRGEDTAYPSYLTQYQNNMICPAIKLGPHARAGLYNAKIFNKQSSDGICDLEEYRKRTINSNATLDRRFHTLRPIDNNDNDIVFEFKGGIEAYKKRITIGDMKWPIGPKAPYEQVKVLDLRDDMEETTETVMKMIKEHKQQEQELKNDDNDEDNDIYDDEMYTAEEDDDDDDYEEDEDGDETYWID